MQENAYNPETIWKCASTPHSHSPLAHSLIPSPVREEGREPALHTRCPVKRAPPAESVLEESRRVSRRVTSGGERACLSLDWLQTGSRPSSVLFAADASAHLVDSEIRCGASRNRTQNHILLRFRGVHTGGRIRNRIRIRIRNRNRIRIRIRIRNRAPITHNSPWISPPTST